MHTTCTNYRALMPAKVKRRGIAQYTRVFGQAHGRRRVGDLPPFLIPTPRPAWVPPQDPSTHAPRRPLSAQVRQGMQLESALVGDVEPGEVLHALEVRLLANGTPRVRFGGGWVSQATAEGVEVLELMAVELVLSCPAEGWEREMTHSGEPS